MVLAGCVRQIMFERGVLNRVTRRFLDVRMDVNVSPPVKCQIECARQNVRIYFQIYVLKCHGGDQAI